MILYALIIAFLIACQPQTETATVPTEEPVNIVKRLATVAPTLTLPPEAISATQTAAPATPTPFVPTATPTPTPYIGVFIGEAVVDPFAPITQLGDLPLFVEEPTSPPLGIRLICDIPEDRVFGDDWRETERARSALQCPIQVMFGFFGQAQVFERGAMYHRQETGEVWAIRPATPGNAGAYWYVGQAPTETQAGIADVPAGRQVPGGAMGAVWFSVPEVREALGFAVLPPFENAVNVQRFDGGTLFLDAVAGQVFVLLLDGVALGPYTGNLEMPEP